MLFPLLAPALLAVSLALPPDVDPALFPGLDKLSPDAIQLAGLSALYPGRILNTPPAASDPVNRHRPPLLVELSRNTTFLRIYDLQAALPKLTDSLARPAVILDLRYLQAEATDAEAFADALARAGLASTPVKALGDLPPPSPLPTPPSGNVTPPTPPIVLALVNRQTAGPLEAWLAAFQATDAVLAVGAPTAGQPGTYRSPPSTPGYYFIVGELQPATGSLVGTGLAPRFPVDLSPEQNYRAYQELEHGTDVNLLLRRATPPTASNPAGSEEMRDPVLQRAVDIVAALQLLGRVPSLPAPAPSTSTSQPAQPGP